MTIPSYDALAPSIPTGVSTHQVGVELYAALHGAQIATLTAIARDFSPRIERHGDTGRMDVVLDVSGLGRLLGDAHTIGAELARAGAERVAIATSQVAARLLARAHTGVSVVDGRLMDVQQALRDLPLTVLKELAATVPARWASSWEHSFEVLQRWGLRTLGELAALPAADLSARLGQGGLALQQLARGIDRRPLVPDPGVPRFIQSMELEWPIDTLEPLSFVFARLLDPLSTALERADRGVAAIRLDLRLTDRSTHTRVLPLPAVMRDPRVLRTLLLLDLESHPPSAAVDIVTIEVDPAPARIIQYLLLERALPSAETLATLNARLAALVGTDRSGSPALLDSYQPDAFEMRRFDPNERGSAGSGGRAGANLGCDAYVTPPLRRFRLPVAVRVTVERGRPMRMAIDRQGMPGGHVTRAAGPWRTSGAWWDQPPPRLRRSAEALRAKAEGQPWDRDEWDVAFSDGAVCRIFRDRHTGVWFVEGVFD